MPRVGLLDVWVVIRKWVEQNTRHTAREAHGISLMVSCRTTKRPARRPRKREPDRWSGLPLDRVRRTTSRLRHRRKR